MGDLKRLCEEAGFRNVRTYIASGNVVAERDGAEARGPRPRSRRSLWLTRRSRSG
jgi:hypothetical protein